MKTGAPAGKRKFSTKILLGVFIPVITVCLAMGSYTVFRIATDSARRLDEKGNTIAKLLAKISVIPIVTYDYWSLEDYIKEALRDRDILYAVILDKSRKPITHSSSMPGTPLSDVKVYRMRIVHNSENIGSVEIGLSLARYRREIRRDIVFSSSAVTSILLLFFFISKLVSRTVTRPLKDIAGVMKSAERGDFDVKAVVQSGDEIGDLSAGFNEMLAEIRRRDRELDVYRSHLEEEVKRRTEALDITNARLKEELEERMCAEARVRQSQAALEMIIQSMPYGVVLIDTDKKIVRANKAALEMAGYEREEDILGVVCNSVMCPTEDSRCPIIDLGQGVDNEERLLVTRRGERIPILKTVVPVELGEGSVMLETFVDIRELKSTKDSLLRQMAAIEASMDGIAILNAEGEYIYVNRAHAEIYGYAGPGDLIGRSWKMLYGDRELRRFEQEIFPAFFRDGRWRGEAAGKRKDGSPFDQEVSLTTLEAGGLICVVRDVTTRKKAEDALRRSEASLANAQRIAHLGNWEWDIRKDQFLGSEEVACIFGFSPAEFGMPLDIFLGAVHPGDMEYVKLRVAKTLSEGEPFNIDHRIILPDGSERVVQAQGEVMRDENGDPLSMSGIVLDITERKRAEEEIRKLNEGLELKVSERTSQLVEAQKELLRREKLAVLGQLAAGMGHELRNPLGVINNAAYFLDLVIADGSDPVREYLDIIKKEVGNGQRIITDLLDFCHSRAPRTRRVSAGELIVQSLEKTAVPENVRVEVDVTEALPDIEVDPQQMGKVIQNLIANSVQAMPRGGLLVIRACEGRGDGDGKSDVISGAGELRGCHVAISIADTGEGISPENRERLYEPLFTTRSRGIGLGLAVSRKLTEANGGRIEMKSETGKGTIFSVILPVDGGWSGKKDEGPRS